jgi:hypothetical protein
MARATVVFQVATLDGRYDAQIAADTPISWWRLGEGSGTTAVDVEAAHDGTYVGSPTLGAASIWNASGNPAVTFDGTNDTVTMGDVAAFRFTGAFSVSFFTKFTAVGGGASGSGLVAKAERSAVSADGWLVQVNTTGKIQFFAQTAGGAAVFNCVTTLAYNDGLWHHVACTWDGSTTANKVLIYVDGAVAGTATAAAGTIATGAYPFRIGARGTTAGDFFAGTITEVSVYNTALSAASVTLHAAYKNDWVSTYSPDWSGGETATTLTRGMADNVPTSRTASVGSAVFDLINSSRSVGGLVGYYSPDSANFNDVTTYGKRVRWLATYSSADYVLWSGRIRSLLPDAGASLSRLAHATAHDAIGDLSLFTIRDVTPQISQTETALIKTIAEALPAAVRAITVRDDAKETYPYALDDLGDDAGNALAVLNALTISAWGWSWVDVYNAIRYRNRTTQSAKTATATLANADIEDLTVLGSQEGVYNRVRVTVHPRFVDTAATTQLCSGAGLLVPANKTITVWMDYRDPTTENKMIGGTSTVTPLTTPSHYLANAAADGSGANLTANISIVTTAFASSAKFVITNAGGTDAYMTTLQLLGKGIYDDGPLVFEDVTTGPFYDNTLDVDFPYKANGLTAAGGSISNSLLGSLSVFTGTQISEVAFDPQRSATLMGYALTMDIGDVVSLSETVTGISAANAVIVGITHEIAPGTILRTRWKLANHVPVIF